MSKNYVVYVELVDVMSETGVSGPYPILRTMSYAEAVTLMDQRNEDRYCHAWIKTEDAE
jgi:hypothetical protein